jgi:hypothetical protein
MKKIWIIAFLLTISITACTLQSDTAAGVTQPPLQAPPATQPLPDIGPSGAGEKGCGDGVCEGPENPSNCPQDCQGVTTPSSGSAPPQAKGEPDYEPPIDVFMVLHIDPVMDTDVGVFKVTNDVYQKTKTEILWLKDEAESHGMRFTALFNGWYPQEALALDDLDQFRALLDAGHEIGTHAHRLTYDAAQDVWIARVDELTASYDHVLAEQTWADAYNYVDEMLSTIGAQGQNKTVCAVAFKNSDEGVLMDEFGFTIAAGQRGESAINYFGHIIWNPWRVTSSDAGGHSLEEDLSTKFLSIPHLAQIGIKGGVHGSDLSLEQIQRRFLMLYTEWLSRERTGAEDKVWTFGFVYHPEDGDVHNQALADFLDWLDTYFIGKTSPYGNVIAQYATTGDIEEQYLAWEAQHPNTSSFSYVVDDPYPYTFEILPTMLSNATFEGMIDLGSGVTAYKFSNDGQAVYMLWSDLGEKTIDFSSELAGQVLLTDSMGNQSIADASSIKLTQEPLFVQPQK